MKPEDLPQKACWWQEVCLRSDSSLLRAHAAEAKPETIWQCSPQGIRRESSLLSNSSRTQFPQASSEASYQHKTNAKRRQEANLSKPRPLSSAPNRGQGFTYYPQGSWRQSKLTTPQFARLNLEAWSDTASNYEREALYRARAPKHKGDSDYPRLKDGSKLDSSTTDCGKPRNERSTVRPHRPPGHRECPKKKRPKRAHSAPVKNTKGIISAATQLPLRDQHTYRLKGVDPRISLTPKEERELNKHLDAMETDHIIVKIQRIRPHAPKYFYRPNYKEDYQWRGGVFQATRAPFKSSFVINPEFLSENPRWKPTDRFVSHFRY